MSQRPFHNVQMNIGITCILTCSRMHRYEQTHLNKEYWNIGYNATFLNNKRKNNIISSYCFFCKRIEFEREFVHFVNSTILEFIELLFLENLSSATRVIISIVRYQSYYRTKIITIIFI